MVRLELSRRDHADLAVQTTTVEPVDVLESLELDLIETGAGPLLALLIWRSPAPHQQFVWMTTGLTALSCVAPAAFADTTASMIALVALHLVAAAIIVPAHA